ncbi:MAG: DUF2800 domain-containing protein [Ruminococcus sp.]|nr:DUF2800 domain-containing protein [Ruminococcus sp.]
MNWNEHSRYKGMHAFLGASKYHWINYDEQKIADTYSNSLAVKKGTELHEFAARCIELGQRLPKSNKTLNMYVNDAVGFKMRPEQMLFYSENCFGTADAISFRDNFLRIHDLKTGVSPAHMEQLYIYNALFCLEYNIKPEKIRTELRIYQSGEVICASPEPEIISSVMDKIVRFDSVIDKIKSEEM